MEIDGAGLRVLTRDECLALLATAQIGRIAVSARALPLILPVRFAMDGDQIVISTRYGTTLDASTRDTVVAFEAEGPSSHSTVGWSVHVNGIARHVTAPVELDRLAALLLPSWSLESAARLVTITTDQLSGRLAAGVPVRPAAHDLDGVIHNRGPSTLAAVHLVTHREGMTTDANGITILDTHTCLALMRTAEVGRLAVSIADLPDIFPINYVVDRGTVVFRTAEGTKLAAALLGRGVAFEVDGYDADAGDAWSVVIKGYATEIEQMHQFFDVLDLPLFPWHAGPKHRFVRIEPVEITGRRFQVVGQEAWGGDRQDRRRAPDE